MNRSWIAAASRCVVALTSTLIAFAAFGQGAATNEAIYLYKGADREARLIEKARAEGSVSIYTSLSPTEGQPLAAAFEKKYGIKVQMWRGLSDGVLKRAVNEAQSRRHVVDVIETNGPEMEALYREKLLAEFYSPHLADIPPNAVPKHRQWIPDRLNLFVVAYNTTKYKREDLPKTYEGFLDPKWKGRLAVEATDSEWMGAVVKTWGEARGMQFFHKLAEMKPEARKGHILLVQMIAAGELDIGLTAYNVNAESFRRRGASVDWAPVEPVIARPQGIAVLRNAPHPRRSSRRPPPRPPVRWWCRRWASRSAPCRTA